MDSILSKIKKSDKLGYAEQLLRSAEQRTNIVYMLIMVAFEFTILVYVLLNEWDEFRYFFGGVAAGAFLIGIVINVVFHKKAYPWIKSVYADIKTATEVGGDFYDYFLIDETHLAIVVGDVSGHGMAAAMFMTLSKTLIKVYAQAQNATGKVLELTNRYLLQSNPQRFFVTGWIGILDLTNGMLTYSNAGHNYPVLMRGGKASAFLRAKPNFVLGKKKLIRYRENRVKLRPGDKLLLYTDGVTEAQSPDEQFFGDERLLQVLGETKNKNQRETVKVLREEVNRFKNGGAHYDDETLLVLSFKDYLQVEPPESKTFYLSREDL